jgi:hypothetical protein
MIPKIRGRKERVRGTIAGVRDHHKPFLTGRLGNYAGQQ